MHQAPSNAGFARQTEKLSKPANPTHTRYGIIKTPAARDTRPNANAVAATSRISTTISAKANAPRCQAKNSQDQTAFAASCATKSAIGRPTLRVSRFRHMSHAAIAMRRYKTVQTGPNNHDGGAQEGRSSRR